MKKFLAALLAVLLCFGMCACAKEQGEKKPSDEQTVGVNLTGRAVPIVPTEKNLFRNGLLAVKKGARWGYIDQSGEFVIPAQFAEVGEFGENGLAPVKKASGWGYINKSGEYVLEEAYIDAYPFTQNGLAYVRWSLDRCGFINENGDVIYEINSQYHSWKSSAGSYETIRNEGKGWSFIDPTGKLLFDQWFDDVWQGFAPNGLAAVKTADGWGYINTSGEFVIQPQYQDALAFKSNGVAMVKTREGWGYIDEHGEYYINPQFYSAMPFSDNGLARVQTSGNGKYGYINTKGEFVLELEYSNIGDFGDNGLAVVYVDGNHGYINESGEIVIQPQYQSATMFYDEGYACVRTADNLYSIIDAEGNCLVEGLDHVAWPIY